MRRIIDKVVEDRMTSTTGAYMDYLNSPIYDGYVDNGFEKLNMKSVNKNYAVDVVRNIIASNIEMPEENKQSYDIEIYGKKHPVDKATYVTIRSIIISTMAPNETIGKAITAAVKDWLEGVYVKKEKDTLEKYVYDYVHSQLMACVNTKDLIV